MKVRAYGKINLTLEVIGKSSGGYHEIKSVLQRISIYDEIEIEKSSSTNIRFNIDIGSLETTVHKTVKLFFQETKPNEHVSIFVKKNIPSGSGLGGGSSDAAAILNLLNLLFDKPLSEKEIYSIAKEIGSDVPFFLNGSTAFVSGRGEVIEPIANLKKCFVLLVFPDFHSPTGIAYDLFDRFGVFSSGEKTKDMVSLLAVDYSVKDLNGLLYNDFEVLFKQSDMRYEKLFESIERISGIKFYLTGSGSSIFSLFESREKAEKVSYKLQKAGYRNFIAETV